MLTCLNVEPKNIQETNSNNYRSYLFAWSNSNVQRLIIGIFVNLILAWSSLMLNIQIFNKYWEKYSTNIWQIFNKYSTNIWQIFNKYAKQTETIRGFPLSPGRVRCTQRELWSCQHQNPGLEKNNQSINFRINGSDHQRIELQKSIYKRTSLLSAKSMSGKIEQVGWKRLGSAYLRHFLFKLLFLPGGCVSGSPRWKQSVDLAKALWRSAVFNVKQQSFSFVLNLGRVQTI